MYVNLILFLIIIIFLTFLLLIIFLVYFFLKNKRDQVELCNVYVKLRDEIRFSIQPIGDIPIGVEEITELAVEIWRIEQRLSKSIDNISDIHKKGLTNSIQRLKRYLEKFDVEIQDYTGQKYNEGLNFDILSREQDVTLAEPIIKETIEPTIICRGRIVKKAKVILSSNQI